MTTVATYTNGNKSVEIKRMVKAGTKRVFFFPVTEAGQTLNKVLYARQYDAVKLGKMYLNN